MRVCVYGAGAIGGHLAVRLARGGADVSVLARGPHLAAIQHEGLTVHTSEGQLHARVQASDDPSALGPQDAVLVTVKAPSLPAVAAGIGPLLKADTPVVFVMNGIPWFYFHGIGGALEGRRLPKIDPGDALWRAVGPERAIAGVVYAASAVIAPGVIELENPNSRGARGAGRSLLAARPGDRRTHQRWWHEGGCIYRDPRRDLEQAAGQSRQRSDGGADSGEHPRSVPGAGVRGGGAARDAGGAAVANALGANPNSDHEKRIAHGRSLDHKPSVLQDLELGRPMEIDGIFDAPLELARMVSVATPTLDLLVAMAKVRARAAGLYPR